VASAGVAKSIQPFALEFEKSDEIANVAEAGDVDEADEADEADVTANLVRLSLIF
jgi:hypothetical protein